MIVYMTALIDEDEDILGVRCVTDEDFSFDMDVETYQKHCKFDISFLEQEELFEYDGKLMTEYEYETGEVYKDCSSMPKYQKMLREFTPDADARLLELDNKRKKKLLDYRQAYYTYLPDEWLQEFAEYHYNHFEGNKGIYDSLSSKQFDLVKEYFRWRSKMLFNETRAGDVFKKSIQKAQRLANLMGDANDWQYDGTEDTGYKGGGHCELGHELRYKHYAYSRQLNKTIAFGQTCMSDFFEVDKDVLATIIKAQETLLKEVKAIIFILQTNKYQDYRNVQSNFKYNDLWEVATALKGQFNNVRQNTGSQWMSMMGKFDKIGLPFTRSMTKMFKRFRTYQRELNDTNLQARKKEQLVAKIKQAYRISEEKVNRIINKEYTVIAAVYIRRFLLAGVTDNIFVEKALTLLDALQVTQKENPALFMDTITTSNRIKAVLRKLPMMHINKPENMENRLSQYRLATEAEFKHQKHLIYSETYLNYQNTAILVSLLKHLTTTLPKETNLTETKLDDKGIIRYTKDFMENYQKLQQGVKLLKDFTYKQEYLQAMTVSGFPKIHSEESRVLRDNLFELDHLGSILDIIATKEPESTLNRVKAVVNNFNGTKEECQLLDDMFSKYRKVTSSNITNKTKDVIPKVEERSTSEYTTRDSEGHKDVVFETGVQPFTDMDASYNDKITFLEQAKEESLIPENDFVFQIITTIKTYNRASDKQVTYLDKAIEKVNTKLGTNTPKQEVKNNAKKQQKSNVDPINIPNPEDAYDSGLPF